MSNPFAGLQSSLESLFNAAQTSLYAIITPIAGLCLRVCFVGTMVVQDQRQVAEFRAWMKRIVIGLVGIYAVNFIISLAIGIGQAI